MSGLNQKRFFGWTTAVIVFAALLLGAMVNVTISWWMAYRPQPYPLETVTTISAETGPAWIYQQREAGGAILLNATAASQWAIGRTNVIAMRTPPPWSALANPPSPEEEDIRLIEEGFGWPLPTLGCEFVVAAGGNPRPGLVPVSAIVLNRPHPHDRNRPLALPLRPLWGGFAVNTAVFAVIILPILALTVVGMRRLLVMRSRWRRRHGRCPHCGYDLQSKLDRGCSECGWNRDHLAQLIPDARDRQQSP